MTKVNIKDVAVGRSDLFRVRPEDVRIKPGWNAREHGDAYEAKIAILQASVAESGVKQPITLYQEDGAFYVSDGHRRLDATLRAIAAGAEIKSIPAIMEDRYASEADRVFSMIVRNSGEPLTPIEQGRVFKRLLDLGWTENDIAAKSGLARTWVVELLKLQAAPDAVTSMVASGAVAATTAMKAMKAAGGDGEKAAGALGRAVERAKAQGKAHATPKHMKEAPAKPAPKPASHAGDRIAALSQALRVAASWFDGYVAIHSAKGAGDKAARNQERADHLRGVLDRNGEEPNGETPFDLETHLIRQRAFSEKTFGPGQRTAGVVAHIRKELAEIEADPTDVEEWVDVIILAFDGAWRAGATAQEVIAALVAKQTKNEGRNWPDWRTVGADQPIEHVREGEAS